MATSKPRCQEKLPTSYDSLETNHNKVFFSEIEDFVWCLQLDEEEKNHETDVFMEDGDVAPSSISDQETKDGVWSSVKETNKDETLVKEEEKKEVIHDETIGKGLAGALKRPLDCSTPNEIINWGTYKLTPIEDYGSWKRKREKRIRKQSPEKLNKFDMRKTISQLVERREAQAKKDRPGQRSDPKSGFATEDKDLDFAGGLTPMLGKRKWIPKEFAFRLI